MNYNLKKRIVGLYSSKVLTPELGKGDLSRKLSKGLELILAQVELPKELVVVKTSFLDEPIDYTALTPGAYAGLMRRGFKTYRDIAKAYVLKDAGILGTREDYSYFFKASRNVGDKTANIIMKHLESRGYQFTKEFAENAAQPQGRGK